VTIRTQVALGKDITIDSLFEEGYKSVFLATGAHKSMKLGIPGEEAQGVYPSMRFLTDVSLGKKVKVGPRISVIGGGNAAVDAARVAIRLPGCEAVSIIYRRTRSEMPAYEEEIEQAIEEGVDIQFLAAPTKVISKGGKITGVEYVRMALGDLDASGRRKPVPIEGSEFTMELDTLIAAIGERPDISYITDKDGFEVSPWNTLMADPETQATHREGVFAGGDVVSGPGTVVEAIAAGKRAAESIHAYLAGEPLTREYTVTRPSRCVEPVELTEEEIAQTKRPEMPCLSVPERTNNFREVELGYREREAVREARRCLRCDLDVKTFVKEDHNKEELAKEGVHA